uniref:Uncharacterized protein n=1 Tax=Arion vulgaris TaxID=1028688 RepID=A0A0B6ZTN4_9EUPU
MYNLITTGVTWFYIFPICDNFNRTDHLDAQDIQVTDSQQFDHARLMIVRDLSDNIIFSNLNLCILTTI